MNYIEDGYLPDNGNRVEISRPAPDASWGRYKEFKKIDDKMFMIEGIRLVHITGVVIQDTQLERIEILPFED